MSNKVIKYSDELRIVRKFTLKATDATIDIPDNSLFMSAAMQDGEIVLFFLSPETSIDSKRRFFVAPSNKKLPREKLHYHTTVKLFGDNLFGHIWEFADVTQTAEYKKETGRDHARHIC